MNFDDMYLDQKTRAFNDGVPSGMLQMRDTIERIWDKQKAEFLSDKGRAFRGMVNVSFMFTDQAKQTLSLAINMVLGHVVWTKAFQEGDKTAKLDIDAKLSDTTDGAFHEVFTLTYGGEYIGKVTRTTGLAGVGRPLRMGIEVETAAYDMPNQAVA